MWRNLPSALLVALLLAGCGTPTAPIPPPPGATSNAAMSAYEPTGSSGVTTTNIPGPPGITTTSSTAGVQELTAPVPNGANHPATMAQGFCISQIQSQLAALVSLAQVGMPMSGLASITQAQNLAQYFAPACNVTPWPNAQPIVGADNLSGQLGQWLAGLQIGKFAVTKQYIKVSPDRTQAVAVICLKATATYPNRLVRYEGWYATQWTPIQGTWLISGITPIDVAKATKVGDTIPQIYFDPWWGPGWGYY